MADVKFSRQALADIAAIHGWLAERDRVAAGRVIAAIEHSAGLLADQPALGRRERSGLGRILSVPRYSPIATKMTGWRTSTCFTRGAPDEPKARPEVDRSTPRVNPSPFMNFRQATFQPVSSRFPAMPNRR